MRFVPTIGVLAAALLTACSGKPRRCVASSERLLVRRSETSRHAIPNSASLLYVASRMVQSGLGIQANRDVAVT